LFRSLADAPHARAGGAGPVPVPLGRDVPVHGTEVSHERRDGRVVTLGRLGAALNPDTLMVAARVSGVPGAAVRVNDARDLPRLDHVMRRRARPLLTKPVHDVVELLATRPPMMDSNGLYLTIPRVLIRGSELSDVRIGSRHNRTPFGHRKSPHSNARGLTKVCGGQPRGIETLMFSHE